MLLGISLRTLRVIIARGDLRVIRVSARRVVIDPRDLDAYVEARRS